MTSPDLTEFIRLVREYQEVSRSIADCVPGTAAMCKFSERDDKLTAARQRLSQRTEPGLLSDETEIVLLAQKILDNWDHWSEEAGIAAQVAQDPRAEDYEMLTKLSYCIRDAAQPTRDGEELQ